MVVRALPNSRSLGLKVLLMIVVSLFLVGLLVLAWLRFTPVRVAAGWHYEVVRDELLRITSLVRLPDGSLLATLSARQLAGETGKGQLLQLDLANGHDTVLADGLYKPDGLLPYQAGVVVTQEYVNQPVLYWREGGIDPLFMLVKPESIAVTAAGQWLIIEDAPNGRLLQIDPHTRQITVLYQGFDAGEGVCVDRDQRVWLVDNKRGDLLEYANGAVEVIVSGLNGPGFLRCTPGGIWITEDVTNDGRLLFWDYRELHTIARHLHSPQAVLEEGNNAVLVAEQGRSRLLRFTRQ